MTVNTPITAGDRPTIREAKQNQLLGVMRARLILTIAGFLLVFGLVAGRLIMLGLDPNDSSRAYHRATNGVSAARPDLLDRNGEILATDIRTSSLYAEPRRIPDAQEAADILALELPEAIDPEIRKKLASSAGFIWLKRELSPKQRDQIHQLGVPGVGFVDESKRFYPGGPAVSHVVGHVDIDNRGLAGIEKYIDRDGLADLHKIGFAQERRPDPARLSIDLRIQHAVRDEIITAMQRYQAIAGVGIVLDANSGEVLAMTSIPDYDPNHPAQALEQNRLNRATAGVFEMGSVFKMFTTAMALDSGLITLDDKFDTSEPIRVGSHEIDDFHARRRILTVPEVFIYSSNIGAAKMALSVGIDGQKEFLGRMRLLDRLPSELPEVGKPLLPKRWTELSLITISFGHGLSVTPMQTAAAAAALVNGGYHIKPTFFPRNRQDAKAEATKVISKGTSDIMRYLMRLNVLEGSGGRANAKGYLVGGKTGTAEKIENGRYTKNKRLNSFLAAFPMDDPQYVILVVLDEPKEERQGQGATAGYNASQTAGNIISRVGPILGIKPRSNETDPMLAAEFTAKNAAIEIPNNP